MGASWAIAVQLLHMFCAVLAMALSVVIARRSGRGPAARAAAAALALTASWAIAAALSGPASQASSALTSVADLGWLWLLYRLFAHDGRDRSMRAIRPVVMALALVQLLQFALLVAQVPYAGNPEAQLAVGRFAVLFNLLSCVGALVLVHNLYAGAVGHARDTLRWPAAALAAMWLYDLNLATLGYLVGHPPVALTALRGLAMLPVVGMLALGLLRHPGASRFQPSRQVAFQSFGLLAIGVYLIAMVLVVQGLSYAGSDMGRVVQVAFLLTAAAILLVVLPSPKLRGWLRVTLAKHLFQHRYDYRAEWLRFNQTIGRADVPDSPLRERIVQAVADITDSPAGLLLTPREEGGLELSARWRWPAIEVPAEALDATAARFFEQSQFILELDPLRNGRAEGIPEAVGQVWLRDQDDVWALLPLLHYERLVGVVVVARPPVKRRLDWEDFDLLRVVGRQLASYLAEQASQDALGEAQRFDEFNRRIAFVMHDIKNLASQLSLLARNAEKHAEKPEFRADMLVTLRNSTEKLEGLLARLGRYGAQAERAQPVAVASLLADVAARSAGRHEVVVIERPSCEILADPEGLEQALLHLVQNAIEASSADAPVFLDTRVEETTAVIEVVDAGCGMSAEFVRTRLFKPFHSSKPGGFGIGAFEARETIRAMGGWLDVETREGLGTRFLVRLPLASAAGLIRSLKSSRPEVA
jgi:putative PEP-CTERM system histidine kinase